MATARKHLRSLKTMAALVDRRRARTPAGALLELSVLANEKERLSKELAAARRRRTEIEIRLAEITEKEGRLHQFVKTGATATGAEPAATDAPRRWKSKEISY